MDAKSQLFYLWMSSDDLAEARDYVNAILFKHPDGVDQRNASTIHKALDISVVITYGRIFKSNHGFGNMKPLIQELESIFTEPELELHKEIIAARDKQYAHSDAEVKDFKYYEDEMLQMSKLVTRHPLSHEKLQLLKEMIVKLISYVNDRMHEILKQLPSAS